MKKIEIIPAILPLDFTDLEDKIGLVKSAVKTVQVDVCDGQFTPDPSWPYRKSDDSFEKILREEMGMPGWEEVNYEFDLMINRPEEEVEKWLIAGAARVIIHAESRGNIEGAIDILNGKAEIGLALNIDTPLETIEQFKSDIQFIQCMGISHIGYQGQKFDIKVLDKISEIKTKYPDIPVSIDGGVSLENASRLVESGADRLVVGSAIFESDNPVEAVRKFKRLGH